MCKTQPFGTRGGTLLPTEEGRWQVTLAEIGGPGPEPTNEGFLEFAKNLPDQTMYNVLKDCEPETDGAVLLFFLLLNGNLTFFLTLMCTVMKYMAMRNEMVCYHEIEMPRGLLAIGDSVMRLNALYGQVRPKNIHQFCSYRN